MARAKTMRLRVGMRVVCQLFNGPDHAYYGDVFTATIIEIRWPVTHSFLRTGKRPYIVRDADGRERDLWKHEILAEAQ